jgi:perosamine synthetase
VVVEQTFGLSRDELTKQLRDAGIDTRTFFCPMNLQPCLQKQPGFRRVKCPVAERLWADGFYLPSSPKLDEQTIKKIAETIQGIAAKCDTKQPA